MSYTQADRAWAEWIAWILEEDGHRVLVQAWDFVPGSNWIQGMQAGVAGRPGRSPCCRRTTWSPSSGRRMAGRLGQRPAGASSASCWVRVKECDRPGLLAGVVSVDLFGLAEAEARARLRTWCRRAAGRAKPPDAAGFPGGPGDAAASRGFPGRCREVWKVPARNPNFTGRGADLAALRAALAGGSTVTVQSLHGMGGVGKTQLAAEFAYAQAADYDLVYWIAAEEPATIPDQFTALAGQLGLDPAADPEALREQVHEPAAGRAGLAADLR